MKTFKKTALVLILSSTLFISPVQSQDTNEHRHFFSEGQRWGLTILSASSMALWGFNVMLMGRDEGWW